MLYNHLHIIISGLW